MKRKTKKIVKKIKASPGKAATKLPPKSREQEKAEEEAAAFNPEKFEEELSTNSPSSPNLDVN